ncbi:MAG: hypothetical protein ABIZ04_19175 [Opitutus sp.]
MKPAGILLLLISPVLVGAEEPVSPSAQAKANRIKLSFTAFAPAPQPTTDGPVIVLPKFEVHDTRVRLSERDAMSSQALLAEAKERYLSSVYQKSFGQISAALGLIANLPSILGGWHPNDAEASVLFVQDERLRRIRDTNELLDLVEITDPAEYKELRQSLGTTFRRDPPWRPHPAE